MTGEANGVSWRDRVQTIIFGHHTPAGKTFDILLIVAILVSVVVVMLDSVTRIHNEYESLLFFLEWLFTVLFTVEYVLRLLTAPHAGRYARSFFGLIDLFAILPSYLSLLIPGGQYLIVIRILRVLRVFRVLKLVNYVGEAALLGQALRAARVKITVFMFTVLTLVAVLGSLMYLVEGPDSGFTSIPRGVYWAIVTLTTVGYGDIAPSSGLGQGLAAIVMIMGYGIIAVPTGIVTLELANAAAQAKSTRVCQACGDVGHDTDARHCKKCGVRLEG